MLKKTNIAKVFSLTVFCGILSCVNPALSQESDLTDENTLINETGITESTTVEITQNNQEEVETEPILDKAETDSQNKENIQTELPESIATETLQNNQEEGVLDSQTNEIETNSNEENAITETVEENNELQKNEDTPSSSDETDFNYTWSDFVSQKDCRDFVSQLNKKSNFENLSQILKPYCNTKKMSAWNKWLYTFRQEKKELIISQIVQEKSAVKYIKVIPYFFFDIQNMNSTGNTPKDILNKIQQAIIEHQPQKAMDLISKLPEIWQKGLRKTSDFGETIIKIKDELDKNF